MSTGIDDLKLCLPEETQEELDGADYQEIAFEASCYITELQQRIKKLEDTFDMF